MAMSRCEAGSRLEVGDLGLVINGNDLPQSKGLVNPYDNPSFGLVTVGRWPVNSQGQRAFVWRWIIPREGRDEPTVTGLKPHVATRSIITLSEINEIAEANNYPTVKVLPEVVLDPDFYGGLALSAAEVVVERFEEDTRLPGENLIVI